MKTRSVPTGATRLTRLALAAILGGLAFATSTPLAVGQHFIPSSTLAVGNTPTSVVAADVNQDGRLDLVTANYSESTLTVLLGQRGGAFVTGSTPAAGNGPYALVAADLNGDGNPDLVSANDWGGTLTVLTNNGGGTFTLAATLAAGPRCGFVLAADVNGDGKPDLIGGNFNDPTLKVFTNDGSGGFTLSTTVTVGSNPGSFVAADLNGDGKAELVGAGEAENRLTVFTRDGDGTFTVSSRLAVGSTPEAFKVADANGDGRPDLWVPDPSAGSLTVWTNNGNGAFGLASSTAVEWNAASWTAADLNGDGRTDIVKANATGGGLTVLTNAGGGSFTSSTTVYPDAQPGSAILAADVTGDRKPDLVFVNSGANSLTVLRSVAPSPATTPHVYDFSIGASVVPGLHDPRGVAVDANGNLYVADTGNHRVVKFTGQGRFLAAWGSAGSAPGEFSSPTALAVDSSDNVYVVDAGNNRIQKFSSSGTYLSQWTSRGPTAVTVDRNDQAYVADAGIESLYVDFWSSYVIYIPGVQRLASDGALVPVCAVSTAPFDYYASQGGAGGYSSAGLTVDGRGNLFVGYSYFYKDPWSGWAGSWSGSGLEKFSNEGTYIKSRPDYLSYAMAVDATDQVYAALASNRIKKYSNDGVALTQWGEPGSGPGQLSNPRGVALDRTGNFVYVADSGNNRIQVFAQRPTLRIERTGGSVIVAWSAAATGFTLQQNAALGTANWVNTTQAVATVDSENRVEIPTSTGFQAFRLVRL